MKALPNPCNSCPYRRDTPPGVWAKEEYNKLPQRDEATALCGTFLCHNAPEHQTVCRGWLEVHHENLSVRLACYEIDWNETNKQPTRIPLYRSGAEARRAGIKGIARPSRTARQVIARIALKRKRSPKRGALKAKKGSKRQR